MFVNMKVILLRDIPGVGHKSDVKDVPDGHARNYLIPRELALVATAHNLTQVRARNARADAQQTHTAEIFAQFLADASSSPIVITIAANEHGHLFKGVGATDIARACTDRSGIAFDSSAIDLARPIKQVGEYVVSVKVGSAQGKVPVTIKAIQS